MTNKDKIIIKDGCELTGDELEIINARRKIEFNSPQKIDPKPSNENWHKKYFLYYNIGQLVSFGRFHEIEIKYKGDSYFVLGMATVISVKRRMGYGAIIVQAMIEYADGQKKSILGFCNNDLEAFYGGYMQTLPRGAKRFYYKSNGEWSADPGEDCLIGVNGKDKLWQKIISDPAEPVFSSRNHW